MNSFFRFFLSAIFSGFSLSRISIKPVDYEYQAPSTMLGPDILTEKAPFYEINFATAVSAPASPERVSSISRLL
jgi:hypothetical protein